jgi:hypothetical protein
MIGPSTRRRVLSMLGMGAAAGAAAPLSLVQKQMVESAAIGLGGIQAGPSGNNSGGIGQAPAAASPATWRLAMADPDLRAEIRSLLFEQHRFVDRLDPDLAGMRSFSLAAKLCFQRQRNVEHVMATRFEVAAWFRIQDVLDRVARFIR